jgi:hypothetical protein
MFTRLLVLHVLHLWLLQKGLCLLSGVVHVVHLGVVMLQLLYIWYIMTFVCTDKIRTSCVLYMLSVGHLDIMCVLYMFHMMYGVIIHTCWNSLLAPQWMSSGAVFSKGKYWLIEHLHSPTIGSSVDYFKPTYIWLRLKGKISIPLGYQLSKCSYR